MGVRRYKATLGREEARHAKVFTVMANSRNSAYWMALGYAIAQDMWPKCLFMRAKVVQDG